MKSFKNVFLLAAMAVSAVFVACDKEGDDFALKDTTLKLTANDGSGTTTITFTSATEFKAETSSELRASGGEIKTGTYTFDGQTLTLTFSDGTIPPITLTKAGDTFTSADYTVTTGDDPATGNTDAFKIQAKVDVPDHIKDAIAKIQLTRVDEDWRVAKKSAEYKNGTLTIELLNPVPSENLGLKDGIKLANLSDELETFDVDGNHLGRFEYRNADGKVMFVYLESDVTVNGLSFKKGWNKTFEDDNTGEGSTTIPSDVKWVFIE